MVCIAAFIILALIGVFVAIISIFKPKIGKAYWKTLKKAAGCLGKKVRLQKCETGFKDDIKNTLLSRVIIKKPKWVKPLSIIIEVLSVIIVIVAIWAILTAIKSLLALWALGSCNVTKPSACSLGAEVCSIDETEPTNALEATGRWFTEWGEIFEAIPDKFKTYNPDDYSFEYIKIANSVSDDSPTVVDIFDPGCSVCMMSYRNQKEADFFNGRVVQMVPFAIQDADDSYKFPNSEIVVRYMFAAEDVRPGSAVTIIDKIFTEKNSEGIPYQNKFNEDYTTEEAIKKMETWLKDDGLSDNEIKMVREKAQSSEVTEKMSKNRDIIENQLKVKGIPTVLIDGKKHTGLWKAEE